MKRRRSGFEPVKPKTTLSNWNKCPCRHSDSGRSPSHESRGNERRACSDPTSHTCKMLHFTTENKK
ncbi:hypothetical protein J6590_072722 [Homalodisca vitripennis]|nr:hypothetical protein J6590_072722 [Homalodisca vitripennis]